MFQKIVIVIAVLAISVGISSCCKKRVVCDGESLNIAFTGFDRSTIRTVILKRYVRGDKERKKALDSTQLVNNRPVTVTGKPDTSWLSDYTITSAGPTSVRYGNDWVLQLTSSGQTFLIADIFEGDNRYTTAPCRDGDTKCTNNLRSYSIDGFWVESNKLYIKR